MPTPERFRLASVFTLFILAVALASGCTTVDMWRWANEPVPRSRVLGVCEGSDGGETLVVELKGCPERPDGTYGFCVPADWRELPRAKSKWGQGISALAEPVRELKLLTQKPALASRECDFGPFEGKEGRDSGLRAGGSLGLYVWRGPERYRLEVFAPDEDKWVHLGDFRIDAGGVRGGRVLAALISTPFTLVGDTLTGFCELAQFGEALPYLLPLAVVFYAATEDENREAVVPAASGTPLTPRVKGAPVTSQP